MKSKKAFTLIELLVVIAIIGILATISVLALSNARAKARDAKRVGDARQIQTALELFFNDNNRYPTVEEWNTGKIYSTSTGATSTYMQIIPLAPIPSDGGCDNVANQYEYSISNDGSSYTLSYCIGGRTGDLNPGPKCLTSGGVLDASCIPPCLPNCSGVCGGDDGCSGTCPDNCTGGQVCVSNTCQTPFNCGTDTVAYNGYDYLTVGIAGRCWFKENLRTVKYNDNSDIANLTVNTDWFNDTIGAYAWFNNDYATYGSVYGALYNFYAVNTGKLCPSGWHVPTHNEFTDLERSVCTSGTCATDFPYDTTTTGLRGTNEGTKLKEAGTVHWNSPNTGADNSSGFTAWGGGFRTTGGTFNAYKGSGLFWSSTITGSGAWERTLYASVANIYRNPYAFAYGFFVRCIQD